MRRQRWFSVARGHWRRERRHYWYWVLLLQATEGAGNYLVEQINKPIPILEWIEKRGRLL